MTETGRPGEGPDPAPGADWFAAIGMPRRVGLSDDDLKTRFHACGRRFHPDGGDEPDAAAFERANVAHRGLRDPASRLRHWLELEFGADAVGRGGAVGDDLMALFGALGETLQRADTVIKKRGSATSALARALLEKDSREATARLLEMGSAVRDAADTRTARLPEVDALTADPARRPAAAELARQLYRDLAFLGKWRDQIKARIGSFF